MSATDFPSPSTARTARRPPAALTIGNFDGVHLGHQALIRRTCAVARASGQRCLVLTFWPHPRAVLGGGQAPPPLTSRAERRRRILALDVDELLELPFTPDLAITAPEEFVRRHLMPLDVRHLLIGHDFSLGRGRSGGPDVLRGLGARYGFQVEQLAPVRHLGGIVSSSRIRRCVAEGDVETAAALLGTWHSVEGPITHGMGRGTGLGFPTANMGLPDTLLPPPGVYATLAQVDDLPGTRQAVTNIGHNPTFGGAKLSIESFLLDAHGDLYGRTLRLGFVTRLREERRFDGPDALIRQIGQDVAQARRLLADAASGPAGILSPHPCPAPDRAAPAEEA
ncbi:riboflavin biosynthesis protein RibF [uncultured Desulfovibrio sp.]|uniref:riboflavin biosynthesis protein RibF n=1 Tax=uncultured Desulfovibrio sp. TaxID=167968 RepID=UPI0026003648|nr:riboflavin biosynthesis protein RibF [uncultured Desulfovibrio sp.]